MVESRWLFFLALDADIEIKCQIQYEKVIDFLFWTNWETAKNAGENF